MSRVLHLADRSQPAPSEGASFDFDDHALVAALRESAVLLKNHNAAEPARKHGRCDRRIRPDAAVPGRWQLGNNPTWSTWHWRSWLALAGRAEVRFAAGFGIGTTDNDERLLREAVEPAKWS